MPRAPQSAVLEPVRSRCLFRPNTGVGISLYNFPPTCNPEPHCYTCQKTKCTHPRAPASSPEIGV